MTKSFVVLLCFSVVFANAQNPEESAVRNVVTSAYIVGIHNNGDIDKIRKGFHPDFKMLRLVENKLQPLAIEDWIASIERSRKEGNKTEVTLGNFVSVDVTGNNAVVKLELSRNNKKIFTDYLVLYKFEEGWRIVSKTFFRHP